MTSLITKCDGISLESLPYSFTRRFIELAPAAVLVEYAKINEDTCKMVKRRGHYADNIWIVSDNTLFEKLKNRDDRTEAIVFNDTSLPCYATKSLSLYFNGIADVEKTIPLTTGSYTFLKILGSYSWKQIPDLVHSNVQTLVLRGDITFDYTDWRECLDECKAFAEMIAGFVKDRPQFFCEIKLKNWHQSFEYHLNKVCTTDTHIVVTNDDAVFVLSKLERDKIF
uniref:MEDS domain-containing protein n=1 Tax=Panagrellus redivivus TaxID=6233 RepID=A0A7E4VK64_PANRE